MMYDVWCMQYGVAGGDEAIFSTTPQPAMGKRNFVCTMLQLAMGKRNVISTMLQPVVGLMK